MIKVNIHPIAIIMRVLVYTLFLVCFANTSVHGQDEPQRVFMYLNYFQSSEEQYLLAEVKYRIEGEFKQLSDVNIDFYTTTDTSEVKLGSVTSGDDGKAKLIFQEEQVIRDLDGYAHFTAKFEGNEGFREATKELSSKRVILSLDGQVEDSVKNLTVYGSELIGGEQSNISECDITVLVKRTYSDLPVAEGALEDGEYLMEFPNDLPGDDAGNLWIIARIMEHDDYGTVEAKTQLSWGIPVSFDQPERPRALWSRAPLWIIIAVTLAFTAAWYHYFLSLSKLFKIRKL